MLFPSQFSGAVDDSLGDFIEAPPLGTLFETVVGLGAVRWAINCIILLVVPLQFRVVPLLCSSGM